MTQLAPDPGVAAIPAGWYPDPVGESDTRWWDGSAWTIHTSVLRPELVQPHAAGLTGLDGLGADDDEPWVELGSPVTIWAWLLVFSPIIWAVLAGLTQAALGTAANEAYAQQIGVLGPATMLVGLVPGWIFAELDRRALRRRNYDGLPSILWMLLIPPFAYLLRRRAAVRAEGVRTTSLDIATLVMGVLAGVQALTAVIGGAFAIVLLSSMFA